MQLYSLKIEGFRKHINTTIRFSDSTFLIGENNVGKSSILYALDYLLGNKTIPNEEFYTCDNFDKEKYTEKQIVLTAEFRRIPEDAKMWRGFKGRLLRYDPEDENDTGIKFIYRKTYPLNGKVKIETYQNPYKIKPEYENYKSIQELLDAGFIEAELPESMKKLDYNKKLTAKEKEEINQIEGLYNFDENKECWIENPGGIPQNVLSRLPKFLLIPAEDKESEISGSSGTLHSTLSELFDEVRENSENYQKAQEYLAKLAKELDPSDDTTEIYKMITELNEIVSEVFPNTGITAIANLSDADKVIKPIFDIRMISNIATKSSLQGTGLIRSTVFALLRYKALRDNNKRTNNKRSLIIGFEEPEIYLHPNAITKMRDTIYNLAGTGNNQIVCTTHSPFMIDLSKKPKQGLNSLSIEDIRKNGNFIPSVCCTPFNVSDRFLSLIDDDKDYIKMLLRVEDSLSKVFFVKNVLIVEGDTEKVVLSETIARMSEDRKGIILGEWYILRARGKAAILPLIRYLKAMNIFPYVMHDKDTNMEGAVKFNEPIMKELGNNDKLYVLENCIENILGYRAPSYDKPYKAYKHIKENWHTWSDLPKKWIEIVDKIFAN